MLSLLAAGCVFTSRTLPSCSLAHGEVLQGIEPFKGIMTHAHMISDMTGRHDFNLFSNSNVVTLALGVQTVPPTRTSPEAQDIIRFLGLRFYIVS